MQHVPHRRSGFTLIEIMIVVVILGILASTVLPQFSNSQGTAQETALVTNLNMLRSQIQLYKLQHNGANPSTDIVNQLTAKTNLDGTTTGTPVLGPYILSQFPANPLNNNLRTVQTSGTADGTSGWSYDPTTGIIKPGNAPSGTTPSGLTYGSL